MKLLEIDTLMGCVKVGNMGKFHSSIYHKFIQNMDYSVEEAETLLDLLVSKYFKYIDVRYFTYITLDKLIQTLDVNKGSDVRSENADSENGSPTKASGQLLIHNIHHVLSKILPLEQPGENSEFEMWNGSDVFTKEGKSESKKIKVTAKKTGEANISKKMKKFSKAWMSFLTLPLPIDVYKEVLLPFTRR